MDFLGGMSNLLQNKLFLQYLSGAGGALGAGQSIAPALSQITQQNIGAQSQAELNKRYMDQISKMLGGGEVPPGWKLARDEKGTKLDIPASAGAAGTPASAGLIGGMGSAGTSPTPIQALPGMTQAGTINPFSHSQPGISAADLAGLGPQDVSRALSSAVGVEALKQQTIASATRARQAALPGPLEERYPIPHPEAGTMSLRQWNALPAAEKEFAAYVHTAKKLGAPPEELTRKFFSTLEPTEREKFIDAALKDPRIMAGAKELAEAARTKISIGERVAGKVAEKKALGKLKGQLWFDDPGWIDSVGEHLSDVGIQRRIFMESQKVGADPKMLRAKEAIKYIKNKISAGQGKITSEEWSEDGNTKTWTVKYPDGEVKEIVYAFD